MYLHQIQQRQQQQNLRLEQTVQMGYHLYNVRLLPIMRKIVQEHLAAVCAVGTQPTRAHLLILKLINLTSLTTDTF